MGNFIISFKNCSSRERRENKRENQRSSVITILQMEKKQAQATNSCSYEDFQPSSNWVREESHDNLVVSVPGFKKDQLRVQVDSKGNMKISGKRPLEGNNYSRFEQDFRIPDNQNFKMDVVHAKLVDGRLYVTIPKKITEPKDPATPTPQSLPAKKDNESKMKPKNTLEANGGVIKGAPSHQLLQPPQQLQPQMENQKSDLTAGDGTVAGSTETNSGGRMVAAVPPEKENIPAAGKRKQEGGFEFGMGGMVSRLKKRRLVVVNVALAIVVVALGVYVTYKLRSGEESHQN
ncbi:hypothetical protein NE237_004550 [Protea cynaroides]|uniref:SHSP domain-containing protein n=1 Tax=Protea cynaroides TaxID=273540 RepID=A0A9Q0KJN1_9MAGN|nr:hypothetical protein NE237_004550 [Protea cynaroides]